MGLLKIIRSKRREKKEHGKNKRREVIWEGERIKANLKLGLSDYQLILCPGIKENQGKIKYNYQV